MFIFLLDKICLSRYYITCLVAILDTVLRGNRVGKQNQQIGDPLNPDQAKALLTSVSVIRDPVHGDIRLTELERTLVDSPEFQRLRNIKQLAMVDLVYPGALHNRFLHSLGTLHVCSEMVMACNNSVKMYAPPISPKGDPIPVRIGYYAELLARLSSLLHDLTHISFGHVFHRDANVFKYDEWQDQWRVKKAFGTESTIFNDMRTFFRNFFGTHENDNIRMAKEDAEKAADILRQEIISILKADKEMDILNLRYPFVHDLVGNTICADLIDYVQRDMYFCGLTEGIGKRFLQYLGIIPAQFENDKNEDEIQMKPIVVNDPNTVAKPREEVGKNVTVCRAVLFQYRYNNQQSPVIKYNIRAEAIDLVRRRKTVAEKLYFHKTKLIATAMLTSAAYSSGYVKPKDLWDKSDSEILKKMAVLAENDAVVNNISEDKKKTCRIRASVLAGKLIRRELFKPLYRTSYHKPSDDDHSHRLWHPENGVYSKYKNPKNREELIIKVEQAIGAYINDVTKSIGSVCISCPDARMQLKEFKMLVLAMPDDAIIRCLEESESPIIKKEIDVIQEGHQELWRLEVFIDPSIINLESKFARQLATAIQHEIGLRNELNEFQGEAEVPIDDLMKKTLVDSLLEEYKLTESIKSVQKDKLLNVASRSSYKDTKQELIAQMTNMGLLTK